MKIIKLCKYIALGITITLVILALAACGSDDDGGKQEEMTPVSVQFSWVHTIEFAGFYKAADAGHYAEANLDVDLKSGGFDAAGNFIPPVLEVVSGKADFGVAGADVLLQARAAGDPVVGIAAIYQRNPVALISLAEGNIRTPEDLAGKRVGVDPGSATFIVYQAFKTARGVADVEEIEQFGLVDPLVNGELDVRTGFVTNEPVILRQQGYEVNIILPSDYGIDLYSNVIFTTEDTLANKPDLVEDFLRATLMGFDDAIDDPKSAAELSVSHNAELNLDNELASMQASLPLLRPAGRSSGMMEAQAWEMTHRILLDQGVLAAPIDYEAAFDLSVLGKIYD